MARHYFLANWSRMNAQSAAADSLSVIVLHRTSSAATVGNLHINTVLGDTHPYYRWRCSMQGKGWSRKILDINERGL